MKLFLTLVGLLIAAAGAYFAYQQYEIARDNRAMERPEVVVCLKSFSYLRTRPQGTGADLAYVPQVQASFKLINKGSTQVTVTKAMFNPTGTGREGRRGGMSGLEVELDKPVPGNGVVVLENLSFTPHVAVADRYWIDNPEAVNVQAYWAGGSGPLLKCIRSTGGRWGCGQGSGRAVSVDSACQ